MSANKVSIAEFYKGRSVLITGGTGFIGKVLIEKLLRSCEYIETIYILLRPKKFVEPSIRLEELLTSEVFQNIREERPDDLRKIVPISSDVDLPHLNISESDIEELAERISVVFHLAASVRFDERLKTSLVTNVGGTRRVMSLCRKLPHLEAVVHLSTAFCNCDRNMIEERIYPLPTAASQIIDAIEYLDDVSTDILTPRLLGKRSNTYTYTKALAEAFLSENCSDLQVAIVRPSIVCCSWEEPYPGWIDCLHGGTGLILAVMKGILRTMYCKKEVTLETVPVDYVVNCIIAAAWHLGTNRPMEIPVYNCVTSPVNKMTWREAQDFCRKYINLYPSAEVFRLPPINFFTESKRMNSLWKVVSHKIPAYFLDWALVILGKRRKFVSLYEKLHATSSSHEPFTTKEWIFVFRNMDILCSSMEPRDRVKFNVDVRGINWERYAENYILGIRKYLLKEDPSSLPSARKSITKRKLYGYITYALLCWLLLYISASLWPTYFSRLMLLSYYKRNAPIHHRP